MIPNIQVNKFLTSRMLATSIFIGSGCYKTYKDYKNANKEYKDKFLIKNSVILSGAALGILASYGLGNKITKSKPYQNLITKLSEKINQTTKNQKIKNSINYTKEILKEVFAGVTSAAFGIFGALGTDYLLSKTKFEQPTLNEKPKIKNKNELKIIELENQINAKLEELTDEDTVDIFYSSMTDMPKFKFIGAGMIGADAIDIAKNKEFDDKLKHTTGYLINDTLIPLLFLSSSTALTQTMKTKQRIPIIFASLFGGTLATHKIFDKITKQHDMKT